MKSKFNIPVGVALFAVLALAGMIGILAFNAGQATEAQDSATIDYAENGTGPVATYTAMDPEGAMVMWSLEGTDAGDFMIENGVLSFKKSPDFEKPAGGTADPPTSNTYEVMVKATDETRMMGMKTVMVKVTNVDEDGKVTLSARRPQSATAFTAMITDPDGGVADAKWQWAKAGSMNGSYSNIANATSETYTPMDADINSYLRATVMYEDNEGEDKSAMMKSDFQVQARRGQNDAPEFADDQDPVMAGDQADAARSVAENTKAGKTVGSPLMATDDDGDTLTYTLTGNDAGHFDIDWATGQIMTKTKLDAENGDSSLTDRDNGTDGLQLEVMVRATDPAGIPGAGTAEPDNSDTVTVNITITDKNEAPAVSGGATATFDETDGGIDAALHTYTATDPDTGAPDSTWSVGGADGSKFNIGNETGGADGQLKFKKKPDYEKPTDANKDNVYEVTVQASDGRLTDMQKVMVTVENAEEDGVVTLSKAQPVVGIPVKATLTDPDGGISKLTWQWYDGAISTGDLTQNAIEDATSDTYTPVADDVGDMLRARAMYFDGHSAPDATVKKTADEEAGNTVELDSRNKPPVFGDEDPDMDGVQNDTAMRKVEENTEADASDDSTDDDASADNVGGAVTATDTKADGTEETLTYTLGGADAAMFRVRDNGQIEVAAGTMLDHETKDTYMVTVMAEDPLGTSASIPVTIMVTDVDEMPDVTGDEMHDYAENGTGPVATYTAMDPEGAMVMWSLEGTDAGDFMIENGVLSFKKSPDFEKPAGGTADPPTSNTYEVMVKATDETRMMGMKTVMVKVTNVDEDGKVTLSARRPQSATAFTAMITDPDGGVADAKWQWAKAGSMNGSYSNIANATSETYTPMDADINSYLRATVMYEDNEGEDKSAMMKSDFQVQARRGQNDAPEFADDQDPVMAGDQADAARSVAENTKAGKTVGSPLMATDDDGDTLTYTLTGNDAGHFDIDWATGQIMTKTKLDAENGDSSLTDRDNGTDGLQLEVMVRATDPAGIPGAGTAEPDNSDTVTVNITITDKNEAPAVSGGATATFDETDGGIDAALHTYTATDPDTGAPDSTWSVGGADGSKFNIGNETGGADGQLKFKKKPDYEKPTDANKDNVYEVTVQASDGRLTDMQKVMVTVENAEEDGVVTLSEAQPVVGIPVKATLTDPDGGISKLTWQWYDGAISTGDLTQNAIEDATSDTYTPVADDVGDMLRARAMYFDGHSAPDATVKKTADEEAGNTVELDSRNKPPVFGDEDPDMDGVQNDTAMRKVEENTEADASDDSTDDDASADNVGGAVTATDTKADGTEETLTYTLGGADAAMFRVRDNGQIEVAAGTMLDHETKDTYMVTVMARDPLGTSASIPVTIMVTDVDEMPKIMEGGLGVSGIAGSSIRYAENRTDEVDTYTVSGTEAAGATLSLEGADASVFRLEGSGLSRMLKFRSAPNYEMPRGQAMSDTNTNTYMVTVKARKGDNMAMQSVTVMVTDVAELGMLSGPDSPSYMENGMDAVGTYMADGPMADMATWMLEGDDASHFMLDGSGMSRMLKFASAPDYEMPRGQAMSDTNTNTYMVIVKAEAGGEMDMVDVTVTVTNENETGMVTLMPMRPSVDTAITATLTDPDMVTEGTASWMWSRSTEMDGNYTDIAEANTDMYTPVATDVDYYLKATATYTDGHGANKMAMKTTSGPVTMTADQDGTVTLSSMSPMVGTAITAFLSDADGGIMGTTWQWSKSMTMDGTFMDITGATEMTYTPVATEGATDVGYYLMVKAMYIDGHGSGKEAMATTTAMVTAVPTGDPLVIKYDANKNDTIERSEIIAAIEDYLFGVGADALSRTDVIKLIELYLFPTG